MRDGYRNYFSETWCAGQTGLAGKPGLEPGTDDPESSVLPLHHFPARGNSSGILYYKKGISLIKMISHLSFC